MITGKYLENPALYSPDELERLDNHIEKYFGKATTVVHEFFSEDIHVDVSIIPPHEEHNYYTLVTTGMGAFSMKIPSEYQEDGLPSRIELMMCLPPEWNPESKESQENWPVELLRYLARFPIIESTWLGYGHSIQNGTPYADNTLLAGCVLLGVQDAPEGAAVCKLSDGSWVGFYQVIPLTENELEYKIQHSTDEMLEEENQEATAEAEAAKGIQSDIEGASPQSEELGASWNSYTVQINGKVLTLPCTIADLESTGLTLDEKSLPQEYEIEAGDYQNAWFKDASKNTIMVDLINTGNDVKEAKDCLVGGIYVEQYSLRNEDLTVIFPGGIQLGTAIDVVQAAYGEAFQHTESELVNVYNWYEDGSFYNSCEIDTNSTDGTVSMMGISRFEVKNGE